MKLASLKNGKDGRLVVVSRDLERAVAVPAIAATMLDAVERWSECEPKLLEIYENLNAGAVADAFAFDSRQAAAPLPRAPQWCDGSAFLNHGRLMEKAFGLPPVPDVETIPLMYQGASDDFLGAHDDVPLPDEADGIDFEAEFGVVVNAVPMACSVEAARAHIILLVQINDVSLRSMGPREMKTGFGFLQAKPSSAFAPVAVTPDELGDAWHQSRVQLDLQISWNGAWFGNPNGREMNFGFDQLIAHAARTRRLSAGTVIGSGTVSNAERSRGSGCIAERRAIEVIDQGAPSTPFMKYGDWVRMEALLEGKPLFGVIDQCIVSANLTQG
ncbi:MULTISPECIES: fumarylacetoacetate hydrolase family protein [Burkholderia]|uniref:Fumarylacetoacetate hydrolase family protein n=2 Tax=Burkholderia contaminans TaxID=488447 RepID=A0A1E3FRW8_9BURK|nr:MULTISPECIES: fumarylacetoacetate hydrolase family protein [Burkholderia]UTP27139.1 fumarylacetoacetate hydrolase family protein [Burkholderia sp. FXe9]KKL41812.1 fumarylacetoacetate hydrolase [Burkholderia contaminans LMG 23361]MBA9832925.1 FAA hydrolase family protein [Burkholderia contaminans]MBA9841127.1 FAA hydrolase family protein [Burkholderia contaminans]MBA9866459.1 FAA hydrolase family protein [Burkholderia contaminans]